MFLKSKIILTVVIVLLFVSSSAYSRGPWEETRKEQTTGNNGIWNGSTSDNQSIGNTLRDDPSNPGDQPPGTDFTTPIGEGLIILSLLSGGYFMLKRRNEKK